MPVGGERSKKEIRNNDIVEQCKFIQREIYIYIRGEFHKFPDFFVQLFKLVVDS